ncbi:MAG: carbohydrate kinase [bacterium]
MLTVLGEALIDLVRDADGRYTAHPGGSPLNVAVGLARLGHPTQFMARFSADAFGRRLHAHAAANGIGLDAAPRVSEPTTLAVVDLDDAGRAEYDFYVQGTADWQWSEPELAAIPTATTVFHTGSLASWTPPGAQRVAALAERLRATGIALLTYDPNVRPRLLPDVGVARTSVEDAVARTHVVKTSAEDLAYLYPDRALAAVGADWLALGTDLVVITRGAGGVLALTADTQVQRAALPIRLVDTIGAGDAFMAGLISALIEHGSAEPSTIVGLEPADLDRVLDEAALVAALTCERAGADPPTGDELLAARDRIAG